jgi:hypothetical protein
LDELERSKPDIRKEDPVHTEAARLEIPPENWDHPTVIEYLKPYVGVRQLWETFDRLSRTSFNDQEWVFSETKEEAAKHPEKERLPPNPSLREVCATGALMMTALLEAQRGGLQGGATDASYMQSTLNAALGKYGLEVVKKPSLPGVKLPPTR